MAETDIPLPSPVLITASPRAVPRKTCPGFRFHDPGQVGNGTSGDPA